MRSLPVLLPLLGLLGCHAASVQPLFLPAQRVEVPAALGAWVEDKDEKPSSLVISAAADKQYTVVLKDTDGETTFLAAAGTLGKSTWVDVQLSASDPRTKPVQAFVLRPHFFLKVDLKEDVLTLGMVEKKWLKDALARKKLTLPYQAFQPGTDDEQLLFTSPTKALQDAVKKFQDTPAAFGQPIVFRRQKP